MLVSSCCEAVSTPGHTSTMPRDVLKKRVRALLWQDSWYRRAGENFREPSQTLFLGMYSWMRCTGCSLLQQTVTLWNAPYPAWCRARYGAFLYRMQDSAANRLLAAPCYAFRCLLRASLTTAGLARPFMRRMTCPTKKAISFVLPPLKASTSAGFSAMTASTTLSMAEVSET